MPGDPKSVSQPKSDAEATDPVKEATHPDEHRGNQDRWNRRQEG